MNREEAYIYIGDVKVQSMITDIFIFLEKRIKFF